MLAVLLTSLSCLAKPSDTPDDVVRSYLAAVASKQDLAPFAVPGCPATHRIRRGGPASVLGIPVAPTLTEVKEAEIAGESATVAYRVKGPASADNQEVTTTLFGKEVKMQVGGLKMDDVDLKGTLELKRIKGEWKLACD